MPHTSNVFKRKPKYTRKYKKSKYNKRYAKKAVSGLLNSGRLLTNIVPQKQLVKQVYCNTKFIPFGTAADTGFATPPATTTGPSNLYFECNNLYDPDNMVGGHYPTGYVRLKALYNRYEVKKSKIEILPALAVTAGQDVTKYINIWVGIIPAGNAGIASVTGCTADAIEENKSITNKFINSAMATNVPLSCKLSKTFTPSAYTGTRDSSDLSVDLVSHETTDPQVRYKFALGYVAPTSLRWGTEGPIWYQGGWIMAQVRITYWVEWSSPKMTEV